MNINDKTTIPLIWVFAIGLPTVSFVSMSAYWVKAVDLRLSRIEDKLGIAVKREPAGLIQTASAKEK